MECAFNSSGELNITTRNNMLAAITAALKDYTITLYKKILLWSTTLTSSEELNLLQKYCFVLEFIKGVEKYLSNLLEFLVDKVHSTLIGQISKKIHRTIQMKHSGYL